MRRLIKLAMIASVLLVAAYFVRSGGATTSKETANKTTANKAAANHAANRVPKHHMKATRAPEVALPAGFQSPCAGAKEHSLTLPSLVNPNDFVAYEQKVLAFLQNGEYKKLGWCVDKGVRDTGPYQNGVYYGTHPAVRIFYSPRAMEWLLNNRQGTIPDGAMIIKEQYTPPAARYQGMNEEQLTKAFAENRDRDWTIMIKDAKGAQDGWFWGEFFDSMKFDDDSEPFQYPWAGFGLYCLRCHTTAENEMTFSSTNNIAGFPGQPILFADDGSWRFQSADDAQHGNITATPLTPGRQANPDFLRTFPNIPGVPFATVEKLPSETYDHIPAPGTGPGQFISSSQCMSCHGALNGPFGPVMFLPSAGVKPGDPFGMNVSPYGEWRWSPMGLAGRDPIFFAQVESELEFIKTLPGDLPTKLTAQVQNVCLSCHGVMGKRQHDTDGLGDFKLDFLKITDRNNPKFKYGALARDGISCLACHRTVPTETPTGKEPLQHFLDTAINGLFSIGPVDEVYGPYPDDGLVIEPMLFGLGMLPRQSDAYPGSNTYLQSSRMCGSCHTINLPVVDATGEDGKISVHSIEQSTYLEWLNSQYQTEFASSINPNQIKTCQNCHMPGEYHSEKKRISVDQIKEKIAIIEDETYPEADNRLPVQEITVRKRDNFRRHEFLGLNVFLLEMFNQFWDVLGVRKDDYMSGSKTGLQDTIDNFAQQAQQRTAELALSVSATSASQIRANVSITNLAGHRFPSGVGFRRAFIELIVRDPAGKIVWGSGRTNNLGVILDDKGQPLPSEFFNDYTDGQGKTQQYYQPHRQVVTAQDQVQIYEELIQDKNGRFTTSFIRRDETFKDNRLLPLGWKKDGPDPALNGVFLKATQPDGVESDPDYTDARAGTDNVLYEITLPAGVDARECQVEATLYHQSIPPSYLNDRFRGAPNGEATRRLYYLTSNLNLTGTVIENWKLKIASTRIAVGTHCQTICLRAPQYYQNRLSKLPSGTIIISGQQPFSTSNAALMTFALAGGPSVRARFNQQFAALQLSLLATPGLDTGALKSPLSCYGLAITPVRLINGVTLSATSTLGDLLAQAQVAAATNLTADMPELTLLLDLLNSNDPLGGCK